MSSYATRRGELEAYFDHTAAEAWAQLTSDAPVSGIRATVRAGREAMRATLLGWLPADLTGKRLLDAGCGTGALSVEAARRGAQVVAIDVAGTLVGLAQERAPTDLPGAIDFRVGDMLDASLGEFDHVVAMDSLIHYGTADIVRALAALGARTRGSMVFTFTPRTPALSLMLAMGKLFPRADRAPAVVPVGPSKIARELAKDAALSAWRQTRTHRVSGGFYTSEALEMVRA